VFYSKVPLNIGRSEPNVYRSYSRRVNCDVHIFRELPHWQSRYSREVTWLFKFDIWYKRDYYFGYGPPSAGTFET